MKKEIKITREQFLLFEEVRESGETNMLDANTVSRLSGLDIKTIVEIIKQYCELAERYLARTPGREN